jgi:hypothetical protein
LDDVSQLGRAFLGSSESAPARSDRAARARAIADAFAARFPATMPPPSSDAVPGPGRHVRVSAETAGQVYVGGETHTRDARARISARAAGMPGGWSVRLTLIDSAIVSVRLENPGSRADPAVLRLQRQMADPAAAAVLAAPLRQGFAGRPVQSETHSLFVPGGLAFLREASVVVALPDSPEGDADLIRRLVETAEAAGARAPRSKSVVQPAEPAPAVEQAGWLRRGHLRIVQ